MGFTVLEDNLSFIMQTSDHSLTGYLILFNRFNRCICLRVSNVSTLASSAEDADVNDESDVNEDGLLMLSHRCAP